MPETHHHSEEGIENEEHLELRRQYEKRIEEARSELGRLFDECKQKGSDPLEEMKQDDQSRVRKAYGDDRIDQLFSSLETISRDEKEQFVEEVLQAADFLFYERFFNPDIKAYLDEEERIRREQNRIEEIRFGTLTGKVFLSDPHWKFELPHKEFIDEKNRVRVLEISWPDVEPPHGLQDVKESFHEMANYLQEHEEIKAVVGISWMMSRKATQRLGFKPYPDVPIDKDQIASILNIVGEARKDKPKYEKEVDEKDVMFGAIGREDFMRMYGE